jgi:hypothetical protein
MDDAVRAEIESLRNQKTKQLRERYRELFGEESRSANRTYLFRRVAWRLQARSEGDLSERARLRAAQLVADVDLRLRPPSKFWNDLQSVQLRPEVRDRRLPPIGTAIEREYRGQLITVRVMENGFEFSGKRYRSLSSISWQVTGTRWNGFNFFRLKEHPQNV